MCDTCREYEAAIDALKRARTSGANLTPEELDRLIEIVEGDYEAFVSDAAEASLR